MDDPADDPTGEQETLLEFPCRFPIKVMGRNESEFQAHVLQLISPHVEDIAAEDIALRKSSNGRFLAVTVTVDAHSKEQLDRIYRTLTSSERVLYAL